MLKNKMLGPVGGYNKFQDISYRPTGFKKLQKKEAKQVDTTPADRLRASESVGESVTWFHLMKILRKRNRPTSFILNNLKISFKTHWTDPHTTFS